MKDYTSNCNEKICSGQPSVVSWTSPANVVKAGFAHPYEMLVPDSCYCVKNLEAIGVNSIMPKCGHCGCTDSLIIHGDVDICGNNNIYGDTYISGKLTLDGLLDPPGLILDAVASVPFTKINIAKGVLWIKQSNGDLYYNNPSGIETNLSIINGSNNITTTIQTLAERITTLENQVNSYHS